MNQILDDNDALILKGIVDKIRDLYLDELSFLFGVKTGKFVHYSTIRRCLVEKLQYSLQVLQTIAMQQSEANEVR